MVSDRSGKVAHGGDLAAARRRFPGAPEPFLDLSTGINPWPWPFPAGLPSLPPEAFTRLPEPDALRALEAVAARRYGAPSPDHVLAAPGTQALLPLVAGLASPGRAGILGPTYAEHARAAALAGHAVAEVGDVSALAGAALAVVVNPNNPDGRTVAPGALRDLAREVGLLVVDEAFMEVGPPGASVAGLDGAANLLVLRSFGKFHGLAGVRLGFAVAAPELLAPLRSRLGPWAVSGPAIALGTAALADEDWGSATRPRLDAAAARLDAVLDRHGLERAGGTALFRLVRGPEALFGQLGRHGILVRRFEGRPGLFRIGLPPDEAALARLDAALSADRPGGRTAALRRAGPHAPPEGAARKSSGGEPLAAARPAAVGDGPPCFDDAFRAGLLDLLRWRRDVRHFRPDPVAPAVLEGLLQAASLAPSVGLSQPWRFVKVDDPARRAAIRANFAACNADALAAQPADRAALYAGLKLAGLDQAPCHLAAFADPTTGQGHGLGRRTMPETTAYSAVMAVHALWLAARAAGLGLGWLSILDAASVASTLDVCPDWVFVGYLCLGYPQSEDVIPELERAGWECRRAPGAHLLQR